MPTSVEPRFFESSGGKGETVVYGRRAERIYVINTKGRDSNIAWGGIRGKSMKGKVQARRTDREALFQEGGVTRRPGEEFF